MTLNTWGLGPLKTFVQIHRGAKLHKSRFRMFIDPGTKLHTDIRNPDVFFPAISLFVRPSKLFQTRARRRPCDESSITFFRMLSKAILQGSRFWCNFNVLVLSTTFCSSTPAAKCFDTNVIKSSNWYWAARLSKSARISLAVQKSWCPLKIASQTNQYHDLPAFGGFVATKTNISASQMKSCSPVLNVKSLKRRDTTDKPHNFAQKPSLLLHLQMPRVHVVQHGFYCLWRRIFDIVLGCTSFCEGRSKSSEENIAPGCQSTTMGWKSRVATCHLIQILSVKKWIAVAGFCWVPKKKHIGENGWYIIYTYYFYINISNEVNNYRRHWLYGIIERCNNKWPTQIDPNPWYYKWTIQVMNSSRCPYLHLPSSERCLVWEEKPQELDQPNRYQVDARFFFHFESIMMCLTHSSPVNFEGINNWRQNLGPRD